MLTSLIQPGTARTGDADTSPTAPPGGKHVPAGEASLRDALPATAGARPGTVLRSGADGSGQYEADDIAQEVAVALEFNGISHATLLATPADLEDFAYGFSYTEGIIRSAADIYDIEIEARAEGIVIQARIAAACLRDLKLRRRNLAGSTGCGLCGLESLHEVRRELPPVDCLPARYGAAALTRATQQLRNLQPLHLATGATHAAGWADMSGNVRWVREDVGRHNALDKLIGHMLRHSVATDEGFAVISSRASFEMVQKTAAAGIGALVAVSAPTTYAVDLAQQLNVMLAGFARGQHFTVYSHAGHLNTEASAS